MSSPVMSSRFKSRSCFVPGTKAFSRFRKSLYSRSRLTHRASCKAKNNNATNKSTYRLTTDVLIEILVLVSVIAGS
jgi:hypothetical protein